MARCTNCRGSYARGLRTLSTTEGARCCRRKYRRRVPTPVPEVTQGYGLLYNYYAITDVRGIAPDGWRVATDTDLDTLRTGSAVASEPYKSIRESPDAHPRWNTGLGGTDTTGFSGLPGGLRSGFDGSYSNFGTGLFMWSTESAPYVVYTLSAAFFRTPGSGTIPQNGYSVRCVRDTEPPSALVVDASGNGYNWVQIGSQYWLTNNLKTTKYTNGINIITGLDNAAWAATEEGAWAYANGDPSLPI